MAPWSFRFIAFVTAMLFSAMTAPQADAKPTTNEASVQLLANFPALQRLGAKGDARAIDKYLARVAAAYREVGHGEFADALPSARTLLKLFGDPASADTRGAFKKARATLRHLAKALAKNPRIVVPAKAGERIPDYYGLAVTFTSNGDRALKRLQAGKSIANFLRRSPAAGIWVTNLDDIEFTNLDGFEFTINDAAVYTFSVGSGSVTSFDSSTNLGYLSGALATSGLTWTQFGGNGTRVLTGRWFAFGPDVEVPVDLSEFPQVTLGFATMVNTVEFPAGTRLVQVPEDAPVPSDAVLLDSPVEIGRPVSWISASIIQGGAETFTSAFPTPSPSPTPAE